MTWSRATAITGSAVVTLASCRIRIVRVHREPPRNCGTMAPGVGRHDEASRLLQFDSVPDAGEQLKARRYDDHPNVRDLIGYSYRKPGYYKFSQVSYERALKADPNHVLTWRYYDLWQLSRATAAKRTEMQKGRASLPGLSFLLSAARVGLRNPYHSCRPCRHPQACRRLRSSSAPRPPWLRW
jgi:hypothetical protein